MWGGSLLLQLPPLQEWFPKFQPGAPTDCPGAGGSGSGALAISSVRTAVGPAGSLDSPVLLTEAQGDH